MKLLDVLYYQYYLYSKKFLKDEEPFAMANWILACSLSFFVNGIINFITAKFFCFELATWAMISILLSILFGGYLYFNRTGRSRKIVFEKPLLFNNKKISIGISILFFLISISWLFWGAIYWPKCD